MDRFSQFNSNLIYCVIEIVHVSIQFKIKLNHRYPQRKLLRVIMDYSGSDGEGMILFTYFGSMAVILKSML